MLFIWTGFLLFSRMSATQPFTPWDVAALRYGGSFLTVLPIVLLHGRPRLPAGHALGVTLTAGICFPLAAYWGFHFAPASHGAVLLPGLLPFLAAFVWWWAFGERWSWRRTASLAVVAAGIGLLASETAASMPGAWRGDLLFAGGCVSWTAYMWMIRRFQIGALEATLAVALLAAPLYLPIWFLFLPSNLAAVPWPWVLFQLVYQGCLSVVVAGFLFTRATVLLGAPQTSAITSGVPALVALGAWPLLGEAIGWGGGAGVMLVTLGMIAGVVGHARPPSSPSPR